MAAPPSEVGAVPAPRWLPGQGYLSVAGAGGQRCRRSRRRGRGRRGLSLAAAPHAIHGPHLEGVQGPVGQARHRHRPLVRLVAVAVGIGHVGPVRAPVGSTIDADPVLVLGDGVATVRGRRRPGQGRLGVPRCDGERRRRSPRRGRRRLALDGDSGVAAEVTAQVLPKFIENTPSSMVHPVSATRSSCSD